MPHGDGDDAVTRRAAVARIEAWQPEPVPSGDAFHQGASLPRAVTPPGRRPGTPAVERKRRQRERERGLVYETEDWQLFLDLATLPQKAGCQPYNLRKVVLKELVDNA